ncbi:MAG: L-threonine 3-dehydrogenase [Pirellulaceae bacterium]
MSSITSLTSSAKESGLPGSMPALKKLKAAPGLTFVDSVELPVVGPRDVLIRVTHAGICGTDRHIFEWDHWSQNRVKVGITTGHEFCGRVVQVGPAVTRVQIGERVSAEGHIGCGVCESCRTGNAHICDRVQIFGIDCDGCFATYHKVPEENVWPVNEQIRDEVAAIFDPLGNAVHTVMTAGVSGKSVLITGVGIIGLMAVTVAKAAGASRIIATDVDEERLKLARELGADVTFNARDSWVAGAKAETWGRGPQVLLEMSGNPHAIRDGFNALQPGGTVAMLGIPPDDITLDLTNAVIFKGATVYGINGRRMFQTWYQMERFVLSGRLNLDPIITHVIDMADFEKGFAMMQSGEAIKVVMKIPE